MFGSKLTAFAAIAMFTAAPVMAAQQPKPAVERALAGSALFDDGDDVEIYIAGAVGAALLIWAFVELSAESDQTSSPN
jgi:hypothetical protein